jgi:hypothetical protein
VIALLLLTATSGADTNSDADALRFAESGEQAYRAGLEARSNSAKARPLFREAALTFERLWRQGRRNPALARNLAQASLLAGDLAGAIRAYHLGLRTAPHDRSLRDGLNFARQEVAYPKEGTLAESARPRERRSLLHYASAEIFWAAAIGLYVLGLIAFVRAWMTRQPGWWLAGGGALVLAAVVAGATAWEDRRLAAEADRPLAIVAGGGTVLHRGNGAEYPPRLPDRLPEGVEMRILGERGGWLQVQLAGGEIGWVDAGRVVQLH